MGKIVKGVVAKVAKAANALVNIVVEDGVAIPAVARGNAKYPIEALQPGQSFKVPCSGESAAKLKINLNSATRRIAKRNNVTFLVLFRNVGEESDKVAGVRVWRTDAGTPATSAPVGAATSPDLSAFIPKK